MVAARLLLLVATLEWRESSFLSPVLSLFSMI
jgi:hypothetical protein